jgi:HpcH/HpaI aldolase/citrate lyase family
MLDTILKPTRSWLFTSATRPDRFAKAATSGVDVAILDLEDSVASSDKDQARATALGFLKSRAFPETRPRPGSRVSCPAPPTWPPTSAPHPPRSHWSSPAPSWFLRVPWPA